MTNQFTGHGGTYEVTTRNGRVRVCKIDGLCSTLIIEYPGSRHRKLAEMYANKLAKGF